MREDGIYNKAWIYFPDGKKMVDYDKIHMVPGWEDGFIAGKEIAWFNGFNQRIGTMICKDMDFPGTVRKYGRENIGMLMVPAWDLVWLVDFSRYINNGWFYTNYKKKTSQIILKHVIYVLSPIDPLSCTVS
ncbi:hypothetical protein [Paenibacillus uliginis]|uniref:hypothetical protein n=1 Tax=Paenibacillus uliginis TaxID=683737 RepID=UPI001AEC8D01|nr:hypothetical protein [Paenibacillus uliginis]